MNNGDNLRNYCRNITSVAPVPPIEPVGPVSVSPFIPISNNIVAAILGYVVDDSPTSVPVLTLTCQRWQGLVPASTRPYGNLQVYANMAATEGQMKLLSLYWSWGPLKVNRLLVSAASGGHSDCMQQTVDLGATNFNAALCIAARHGHSNCMQKASDQGATNFNAALCIAAHYGYSTCMQMAADLGAFLFDKALISAARYGHQDCMQKAVDLGARNFDGSLLHIATLSGNPHCMQLATDLYVARSPLFNTVQCSRMHFFKKQDNKT